MSDLNKFSVEQLKRIVKQGRLFKNYSTMSKSELIKNIKKSELYESKDVSRDERVDEAIERIRERFKPKRDYKAEIKRIRQEIEDTKEKNRRMDEEFWETASRIKGRFKKVPPPVPPRPVMRKKVPPPVPPKPLRLQKKEVVVDEEDLKPGNFINTMMLLMNLQNQLYPPEPQAVNVPLTKPIKRMSKLEELEGDIRELNDEIKDLQKKGGKGTEKKIKQRKKRLQKLADTYKRLEKEVTVPDPVEAEFELPDNFMNTMMLFMNLQNQLYPTESLKFTDPFEDK